MLQNPSLAGEVVLQVGMTKPPTSVRSIRLPSTDWEWLSAEAEKRGTTVNGLVAEGVALVRSVPKGGYTTGRGPDVYADGCVRDTEPSGFTAENMPAVDFAKHESRMTLNLPADYPGATAVHVTAPVFQRKAFNPQPKKGKAK